MAQSTVVQLRNAHLAVVERRKLLAYILNVAHPDNGGKAQFFGSLGFTRENPELLVDALRAVAQTGEVVAMDESTHGEKYVVDGRVSSQLRRVAYSWCGRCGSSIEARTCLGW